MNLKELELAIRKSWGLDTCHPDGLLKYSLSDSSYGQCGITSLLIQEVYGGEILFNKAHRHTWNLLPDGRELDLTRNQFPKGTIIEKDGIISRHDMFNNELAKKAKVKERYEIFKEKVLKILNRTNF